MKTPHILFLCILLFGLINEKAVSQPEQIYEEIEHHLQNDQLTVARKKIEKALYEYPEDAELYYLLGVTLIRLTDEVSVFRKLSYARRGRESLEKSIELNPELIKARKELSDYYFYAPAIAGGSRDKALEILQNIKPYSNYWHLIYTGDYYVNQDNLKEAQSFYLQARQTFPDSVLPFAKLGENSRRMKQYVQSKAFFEEALQADSAFIPAYFHIGLAGLLGEFDVDESIRSFETYISKTAQINAGYTGAAYYRIGMLYELKKDNRNARLNYRKALEFNPELEAARTRLMELEN